MEQIYTAAFPDGFPFEMNNAKGNMVLPPVLHRHDCLELNYIISGNGTNYIENKKYEMKAGELYLINNLEHHIAVSGGDLKMKIVLFDPALLFQNTAENLDLLAPFYSKILISAINWNWAKRRWGRSAGFSGIWKRNGLRKNPVTAF